MTTLPAQAPLALEELERALSAATKGSVYVVECTPLVRATTHPLWRVAVMTAGDRQEFVLKDLTPGNELPGPSVPGPPSVQDPCREVAVYRSGLSAAGLAPAVVACSPPDSDRPWALIELVDGIELWQHEAGAVWREAARTLADLHGRAGMFLLPRLGEHLLVHDRAFYERWGLRALAAGDPHRQAELRFVVTRAERATERLLDLPRTLIHGESQASNILVRRDGRCVLIDWEMAAAGPGLWDLAALVAGWAEPTVEQMADAYRRRIIELGAVVSPAGTFSAALDACRLQQCVQWLGWSQEWVHRDEHRRDWLADAVALADRLEP
jgi:aminoglycoside phosphotransferase (APT) family kinase protein